MIQQQFGKSTILDEEVLNRLRTSYQHNKDNPFAVIVSSLGVHKHGAEHPFRAFSALVASGYLEYIAQTDLPALRGKTADGGNWPTGIKRVYRLTVKGVEVIA